MVSRYQSVRMALPPEVRVIAGIVGLVLEQQDCQVVVAAAHLGVEVADACRGVVVEPQFVHGLGERVRAQIVVHIVDDLRAGSSGKSQDKDEAQNESFHVGNPLTRFSPLAPLVWKPAACLVTLLPSSPWCHHRTGYVLPPHNTYPYLKQIPCQ